ncbi:DUF5953 family protein [Melittangium boletus]|uniref:DUF5953 family protein n=1 Tax=Melittangium boletus TaxID=83453 RepID=UPI003CCB9066
MEWRHSSRAAPCFPACSPTGNVTFPRVTVRGPWASHGLRVQGQAGCPGPLSAPITTKPKVPLASLRRRMCFEAMAAGASAWWGHATPFSAGVEIARQTIEPVHKSSFHK